MNRDQAAFADRLGLTVAIIQAHNHALREEARKASVCLNRNPLTVREKRFR
jgi:hypothetical protein